MPKNSESKKTAHPKNIVEALARRVASQQNAVALKFKANGRWAPLTWQEYGTAVSEIALGLLDLGVSKGDRISLLSTTRPEWSFSDMAILSLGAVAVPIYQSSTPADVNFILEHSDSSFFFVENETQLEKVDARKASLRGAIILSPSKGNGKEKAFRKQFPFPVLSLSELRKKGSKASSEKKKRLVSLSHEISEQDLATIVYTSGTTGTPKGAMLRHEQIISELSDIGKLFDIGPEDSTLSFLPYAHIFGRVEHFAHIWFGWCTSFAESIEAIAPSLAEVRPTLMFSVPRIYEKAYQKILSQVREGSPLKQRLFEWSLSVGREVSQLKQAHAPLPPLLQLKFAVAYGLVFSKLNKKFGGRIRFFISGGAPLAREIAEFFHAAGILILEGYGLTETTAAITVNREDQYRFGSVGPALPDVKIKIDEEGEILVKSAKVFAGYWNDETATRAAFTEDGFFRTGDIGEVDAEGILTITDRKKDLIVTSAGKNIAPQKIENLLKTHPIISQALVHGDKRNYLTALLALNPEVAERITTGVPHSASSSREFHRNPEVINEVHRAVSAVNAELATYEQIKQFRLLERELSIDEGELTPSLKIKRRFCEKKYRSLLDRMYEESAQRVNP